MFQVRSQVAVQWSPSRRLGNARVGSTGIDRLGGKCAKILRESQGVGGGRKLVARLAPAPCCNELVSARAIDDWSRNLPCRRRTGASYSADGFQRTGRELLDEQFAMAAHDRSSNFFFIAVRSGDKQSER